MHIFRLALIFIFISPGAIAQNLSIPHIVKKGDIATFFADDKPSIIPGGELGNSSASSL